MNLRRFYLCLLLSLSLCFVTAYTSYASIVSETEPVKSWQEAVDEVKAKRAVASASEAQVMTLDLIDTDYGIMPMSSVGTVTNTVDRTGIYLVVKCIDGSTKTTYIHSDGTIEPISTTLPIVRVCFRFSKSCLPTAGIYKFAMDFSSDFSFDLSGPYLWSYKSVANATDLSSTYDVNNYSFSSGDLYVPGIVISLGNVTFLDFGFNLKNSSLTHFSGSARFCFEQSSDNVDYSSAGSSAGDIQADYQSGVTSGLSNIGDTLEEIVETISLQLEALWNQMYNYMHLPQYEKLEQIRQAIENIRLDVDVDNQDVVNKLDEQIQNDNANTQRVEQAVEKHGNFIIEGLKSLFIPDEEYFSSLFDRLHQFFSDRLGFLYVPFDLLIELMESIRNADTAFAGIPFPGIRAGEWVLLEPTTVTFDVLNEFPELVSAMHFITSTVMIGAFLSLLHRKIEEVQNR